MSFDDIKAQDSALSILKENIAKNRISSSYLFAGPDGIGKAIAAQNFAKAINCLGKDKLPCDNCASCRKIDSKSHPDVFFIEPKGASSSIVIDQIRTLIAKANLKPYEGKRKVFIVDKAHSMNQEAGNAFLKTLEEPTPTTTFILLSRSKELLLSTIASRCQVINFSVAEREVVKEMLKNYFSKEGSMIDEKEAEILTGFSGGRIGEAIRMKEEDLVQKKNRILDSLSDKKSDFEKIISEYADRDELKEYLEFLISYFRDVFLVKSGSDISLYHKDRLDEMHKVKERLSSEKLEYLINKIITLRSYIDYNVNPKIIIDVLTCELRGCYA